MSFGLDLSMSMGLEQRLSPQMIQSLKLLQMNSLELEMVVKQELESNPMLEILEDGDQPDSEGEPTVGDDDNASSNDEPAERETSERKEVDEESGVAADHRANGETAEEASSLDRLMPEEGPGQSKEIDWESYLEDGFDQGDRRTEELESPDERFEKVPVYSKTLQDHLLLQLQDRHAGQAIAELVEYLIYSLDDRGWLTPEVKAQLPVPGDKGYKESMRLQKEMDDAAAQDAASEENASLMDIDDLVQASLDGRSFEGLLESKDKTSETYPGNITPHLAKQTAFPTNTANSPLPERPEHAEMQAIIEGHVNLEAASQQVREAFHVLHSLDPAGIGARNLRECLILQIERTTKVSDLARRIVFEAFDLLEKLKIAAIAKKFEIMPEQVQAAIREIGTLEPHPGRQLGSSTATPVIPDLLVEEIDGELILMLNDKSTPSLRVSRAYAALLKKGSRATTDEKKYVRDKLNSATWLIRAIEQRKSTMIKVMQAIIDSQPNFFVKGPTHLKPLILQDVADKISMHISTVSRVTNGKYVQTLHGIFELKYFFSAGVTQSDGSEVSSVAAKDEIKKLIESEDPFKPLSDQKIVEILKDQGIDVARRTVAKYRDQLEILPARLRKSY
jgi:RNA polymerase sigma-54 factor